MKAIVKLLGLAVLAFASGTWFGRSTTPKPRILIQGEVTSESCGGGRFTSEEIERINEEIPGKLDSLLGAHQHEQYLVTVTPLGSGYSLWMAGLGIDRLWDLRIQRELRDWVMNRMDAIQLETLSEGEKRSSGQPTTKPTDKGCAIIQPSPPAEE